jgi:chondroitin sulfate synthase
VVYFGKDAEKVQFLSLVDSLHQNQSNCQVKVVQVDGEFSRGIGLETGISQCKEDDLLFLVDVDIAFSPEAVERILVNAVQGSQVYFPIVFSEYSNDLFSDDLKDADSFQLSMETGYWREFGFGIVAFYKSDFKSVGGFDVGIRGWGKEDVALFDKFLKTNLTVFRSPDPELLHIYHPVICDPKLSHAQHEMCLGTQASTLGSSKNLLNFILKNRLKSEKLKETTKFLFNA